MTKYPHVENWLKVWARELAILKWSTVSENDVHHFVFTLTGILSTQPVLVFDETFDQTFNLALAEKDASDKVSELMDISFRVNSKVNYDELVKEADDLQDTLIKEFGGLGLTKVEFKAPLKLFCFLHRYYSIEISAMVKAYEPSKHNPTLGIYQPMLEELLGMQVKQDKEAN
ncbi:hypothetical protein [Vibrio phage phiKT1019]|nr:hypothetical protein [Vibrio phage phiKT1019]